jgi:5-methylthioadenosine/S-adenosylhomocysteine deaminase
VTGGIADRAGADRRRVDLLIRGGVVLSMDAEGSEFEGDVTIEGDRIACLGPRLEVSADRVIDARGGAVLPGFVNAHMHECLERGWFEDLPFMRWLEEFALPKDRAYEPRHMHAAALLNQLEMIQNGTTSFIDIFRFPAEAAAVAERSGLRATFSPQIIDEPAVVGESLAQAEAFVSAWRDRVPDRIRTWFGPHSLYSCEERTYCRIRELADELDVGIHTHLAESREEVTIIRERTGGLTPAGYLDRLIGLDHDVVAAHCIQLTDHDVALLAEQGVGVAHCPTSNMKLGNGAARILDLLAAGATVGLGTDSIMTNNDLDMFGEMRQAALLQKLTTGDATVLPCREVLRMATIGSARALGLDHEVGSLEAGKLADVIVVDLKRCHAWPVFRDGGGNVAEQLVYACNGGDVRTTIVGGRVLMEDGLVQSLDEREVEEVVQREARHLLEKAGVGDAMLRRGTA